MLLVFHNLTLLQQAIYTHPLPFLSVCFYPQYFCHPLEGCRVDMGFIEQAPNKPPSAFWLMKGEQLKNTHLACHTHTPHNVIALAHTSRGGGAEARKKNT